MHKIPSLAAQKSLQFGMLRRHALQHDASTKGRCELNVTVHPATKPRMLSTQVTAGVARAARLA
jgi:hypothetical protein